MLLSSRTAAMLDLPAASVCPPQAPARAEAAQRYVLMSYSGDNPDPLRVELFCIGMLYIARNYYVAF